MTRITSFADEVSEDRRRMLAALRRPLLDVQRAYAAMPPNLQATASQLVPHGTTIGAFLVADGRAVIGFSDGKVSIGPRIASLDYQKVITLDSHTAMLIAGSPVIGQSVAGLMRAYVRSYQDFRMGRPMSVDAKRKQLSRELLGNFGLMASGLLLAPILATYDRARGRARIFAYTPEGSFNERSDDRVMNRFSGYATSGSGEGIYKLIKERRTAGMTIDAGVALAEFLITDSGQDDSASGGRTFVTVIDEDGIRLVRGGGA